MATPASSDVYTWDALLNGVHVWQLRPRELRAELAESRSSLLSQEERDRYASFQTTQTRDDYLAARVLCRATLSRYTGRDPHDWRFSDGAHGKPALVEAAEFPSLRFNLTHTDDLVLCAVTRAGEVGVDAELCAGPVDAALVARHFLSRRQHERLAALNESERHVA
ncbi:MAG: hypothetical protein JO030_04275, partial [Candidatus Eremiobacteraeota bacterium]|nr:hypothetical protein [Candidatus Eremiobacteraeota bacterium]